MALPVTKSATPSPGGAGGPLAWLYLFLGRTLLVVALAVLLIVLLGGMLAVVLIRRR